MHSITEALNDLVAIKKRLSNGSTIRKLAKHLKKNTQPLSLSDENESLTLPAHPGIYYFEAKFNFLTINDLDEFGQQWGTIRGSDLPKGISRYYPERAKKHEKRISRNGFIPFYLGIREDISKRVINHIDGEKSPGTYSLKLRSRPDLLNGVELRYSYHHFDIDLESYFGIKVLEENLRELLNPIIGKQ
jgi:hypothetical protein